MEAMLAWLANNFKLLDVDLNSGGVHIESILFVMLQCGSYELIGWMHLLLGATLSMNKSSDKMRPYYLLDYRNKVQ